jgi:hypothetical protein
MNTHNQRIDTQIKTRVSNLSLEMLKNCMIDLFIKQNVDKNREANRIWQYIYQELEERIGTDETDLFVGSIYDTNGMGI